MHSDAKALWRSYAEEFEERWGIERGDLEILGNLGGMLFDAEYAELGDLAYKVSTILPIRNAFYSAHTINARWRWLSRQQLPEPILDYGCGVGFLLRWLRMKGFKDLRWYDVPGVQYGVTKVFMDDEGTHFWDQEEQMGTIICMNVLEHLSNPTEVLEFLRGKCERFVGNIDLSGGHQHIADDSERERIAEDLKSAGEFWGVERACSGG